MISKPSSLPTAISLLASLCFLASCDGPKTESVNYDDLGWKKNVYYFKKHFYILANKRNGIIGLYLSKMNIDKIAID